MSTPDVIAVVFALALAAGFAAVVIALAVRAQPSSGDLAKAGGAVGATMVAVVLSTYRGRRDR